MTDQSPLKTNKRKALMSYLQTTDTSKSSQILSSKSEKSELFEEQYVEESPNCNVCAKQISKPSQKKTCCGFCQLMACKDHLRKRRVKNNKWEKICDGCEDKLLFDLYMKLEIKAEEALLVEEEIVSMKCKNLKQVLQTKQIKRRQLSFIEAKLQDDYQSQKKILDSKQHKLQSTSNKIESLTLQCQQLKQYISRMQQKIKQNYQQDYQILEEQNESLGKDLTRQQKKCIEARNAIDKREKQLENAYDIWERKQYEKNSRNVDHFRSDRKSDKEKCSIF